MVIVASCPGIYGLARRKRIDGMLVMVEKGQQTSGRRCCGGLSIFSTNERGLACGDVSRARVTSSRLYPTDEDQGHGFEMWGDLYRYDRQIDR